MSGWRSGYPPTPISSKPCPRSVIAESSSNALENAPTGFLTSPPMTKISPMPRSSSRPVISSRCALSATSRAEMWGTTRKSCFASRSASRRVLSIPCAGEHVTVTFAPSGRSSTHSSAPFVGITSYLGCASTSPRATPLSSPVSASRAEIRRVRDRSTEKSRTNTTWRFLSSDPSWGFLFRIYKGPLHDPGRSLAGVRSHRDLGPQVGVLDGHKREPDVLLQSRRVKGGGDLPDPRAVLDDLQVVFYVPYQRVALYLHADHLALDPFGRDTLQRLFPDEVGLLVQIDRVFQPGLVGIQERVVAVEVVVQRYIGAVAEDAGLHPSDLARPDHREVVRLTGLEHPVPELHPVAAGISQVDLVPHLAGISGPGDDDVHTVELVLGHPVVPDVQNLVAEKV